MNFGLMSFPKAPSLLAQSVQVGTGSAAGGSGSIATGSFGLKAGIDSAANALICLGPDGLAYPVQTTDYSATSLAAMTFLWTPLTVSGSSPTMRDRYSVMQAPNGDIYVCLCASNNSNGYGLAVYRYSASGALISYVVVDNFQTTCYSPRMEYLSDGNIVVTYSDSVNLRYAILSPVLAILRQPETVEAVGTLGADMIALAGGGFMLTFSKTAVADQLIAVYDNSGNVVTAKKVIKAGAAGGVTRMAQLNNGNVAFLISVGGTSSIAILSPAADIVLAFFAGDASNLSVDISALPGYFAVAVVQTNNNVGRLRVYRNDGVLQGAPVEFTSIGVTLTGLRLINDGSAFWLSYTPGASLQNLSKVTIAAVVKTWAMTVTGNRTTQTTYDMFYERNRIVISCVEPNTGGGASSSALSVFNTIGQNIESFDNYAYASMPYGPYTRIIPGGDFSVITLSAIGTTNSNLSVRKYANTSVVGVGSASAVAGGMVPIVAQSGIYTINYLKGSPSKVFDHSAISVMGNKGTILNYGAILKGY